VGRSNDCHLKINDISVSRFHCLLTRGKGGELFISDKGAKFGTLIMLHKQKIPVLMEKPLPIQLGRSFFEFGISTPWYECFICCDDKLKNVKKDYQKMNAEKIPIEKEIVIKIHESLDENSMNSESALEIKQSKINKASTKKMLKEDEKSVHEDEKSVHEDGKSDRDDDKSVQPDKADDASKEKDSSNRLFKSNNFVAGNIQDDNVANINYDDENFVRKKSKNQSKMKTKAHFKKKAK